jgi:NRAMP (natural resistance-associated macrophage protein)-like metal ion transporter
MEKLQLKFLQFKRVMLTYLAVFGPATITAMADNDAAGVATYSIAGAKLGYPILFALVIVTLLLAVTQEMGVRLTLVTRKGLADMVREHFGVKISLFLFVCLFIANLGTIIVDIAAMKAIASLFHFNPVLFITIMMTFVVFFVVRGNYKSTQNIMLISSLFFLAYIISAFRAQPNWSEAVGNLIFPHGVQFTQTYIKDYILIGMGVLGTTITPWGQFFISSFMGDKNITKDKLHLSRIETYFGAFLTDFFSFFMIVATAATLYVHHIPLESGEQAALAIKPFAGELAAYLFAFGIFNAGFMGVVTVGLTTAYAFTEFFGLSGSLDSTFTKSKTFYRLFIGQIVIASLIAFMPSVSLFQFAIAAQTLNAMMLPVVFFYLLKFTSNKLIMGEYTNTPFQKNFATISTVVIIFASLFTVLATVLKW